MKHECSQDERFKNVERDISEIKTSQKEGNAKLDQIAELLIQNARIDVHIAGLRDAVDDHEERLRVVEKNSNQNSWLSARGERLFWLLLAGLASLATYGLKGG